MTLRLARPLVDDYAYLAKRMRGDEIAQFLALSGLSEYDPDIAARCFVMMPGRNFVLLDAEQRPIVAGGFEEIRPRVYQAWMVGSDAGWAQHWRAITKYSRRLMDELFAEGALRIQTCALESRCAAHVWYERGLRQRYEGTHACFFADGQSAVCYARTRTMYEEGRHGLIE